VALITGGGSGTGLVRAVARKSTAATVNTTVAETDLLNGEITAAGGTIGTTGIIVGKLWGDWKQNSGGAAAGPRFRLKFGGTTVFDFQTFNGLLTVANVVTRYAWEWNIVVANQNATNVQDCSISGFICCNSSSATTAIAAAPVTGEGVAGAVNTQNVAAIQHTNLFNTAAVDTTASAPILFTTVNGSASALYEVVLAGALFTTY
jgi:hypothetical protein